MTENLTLTATSRETVGKANRRVGADKLPAVLYGASIDSKPISLDRHEFELAASHSEGMTARLIELSVDGHKPVHVIAKSIQHDPVKGTAIHVDLWAVNMRQNITTTIALHFIGDSVGVKAGGVMMHNVSAVQIESLPGNLPEHIEADISALEVGDSLHIRDLVAPAGVTILDDADEIVASVVPPAKSIEEEEAEAAEAGGAVSEPEVIGEKSEEE